MGHLILTMLAFAVAAVINTASVAVQQSRGLVTRKFGRAGWYVHLAIITPAWIGFFVLLSNAGRYVRWPLPEVVRPVGIPVLAGAALLWLIAFVQLGPARTGNGDVFGHASPEPIRRGIFRWLRNPMYDSYALAFVGAALQGGNAVYLLLAAESFVLLNLIEARIENKPFDRPKTDVV